MKIAYLGNFSQRHCTEVHLAATLENLGHTVGTIQEDPSNTEHTMVLDNIDLFLWTRTSDLSASRDTMNNVLEQYKKLSIPTASYHLDLYVGLKREDGLDTDPFWKTDYVFTPDGDPASQKVFEARGINHIYMKPGVFEPECTYTGNGDTLHEVIFVGGGEATGAGPQYGHAEWPYRGKLIKFLRDTYDSRFEKFGWPQETIRNEALNQLYANSKIVVGDSLCLNFNHPYYWSDRVYETMGRGGFIIHPFIKGMDEEFTDGETISFYEYNNWDQLKAKIDYFLEHDEEREKIRLAGHNFVKKNATYTNRLKQMLEIIFLAGPDVETGRGTTSSDVTPESPPAPIKISLGAGTEPEEGFVNVDIVNLDGIDVVHNFMHYPWPFEDESASYIKAKDVIEHMATHLPDGRSSIIAFIEECHRILQTGGKLFIQTPSWKSDFLWIDPTHVRGYDKRSFDFFDPETDFGRATGFYSEAKFKVLPHILENGNLQFILVKR